MGLKRIWLVRSRENAKSITIAATGRGLFHRAEIEPQGGAPATPSRTCRFVEWQNGREVAVMLHQWNLLETHPTSRVPQGCLTKGSLLPYHLSWGSGGQESAERACWNVEGKHLFPVPSTDKT